MGRIAWYANRLRAMSVGEVAWRLSQKRLQGRERAQFARQPIAVWDGAEKPLFDAEALGLNFNCKQYSTATEINLLGGYRYADYATQWHSGFQTAEEWPKPFSYDLHYKQRDDIGDARTNWELNRHFQFALLAKAYYATGDKRYLDSLTTQIEGWNHSNPFLYGISWTSVMEVAIRCINWTVAAAFLCKAHSGLAGRMAVGIERMAGYVAAHYSRYSSANNHLLVEACSLVYAGSALHRDEWKTLGIRLLDEQWDRQNCSDGVNREMSLHYQTFGMEAYALAMHMVKEVQPDWKKRLQWQCEFVAASMCGDTAIAFGDNDEGKIIDLEGTPFSHYQYVLQLCSLLTGVRYTDFHKVSENVRWLFTDEQIAEAAKLPQQEVPQHATFAEGGYSFLRSKDSSIVVAIDHAPLGFGSIAAHGHADALSFQLYVDGQCMLGDPGTFIYHCWKDKRDDYRKSENHNTLSRPLSEQSQMLGAFMWGKRAQTKLTEANHGVVEAACLRADGVTHQRRFEMADNGTLRIEDRFAADDGTANLIAHPACKVEATPSCVRISRGNISLCIESTAHPTFDTINYSEHYGTEQPCTRIRYKLTNRKLNCKIWIEKY